MNNPMAPQQPAGAQQALVPAQTMRGIDPSIIKAMLGGLEAKQKMAGVEEQMAEAKALRDQEMPEMVGETAASPLSFLANVIGSRQGKSDLNQAKAEASALRGDIGLGEQAGMIAEMQEKGYMDQQTLDAEMRKYTEARNVALKKRQDQMSDRYEDRGWQRDDALEQRGWKVNDKTGERQWFLEDATRERQQKIDDMLLKRGWQTDDIKDGRAYKEEVLAEARSYEEEQAAQDANQLATDYETWYDAEGNPVNAARTVGGYMVDGAGNKLDMSNLMSKEAREADNTINAAAESALKDVPVEAKKDARNAYVLIDTFNDINTMAAGLSPADMKKLSNPAIIKVVETLTPDNFENYVKSNWLGLSSEAKAYLQKLNEVSAKIRHGYYGSALTGQEIKFSNAWLPNETGMKPEDIQRRGNALKDSSYTVLKSVDDLYGTKLGSKKAGYDDWYKQKTGADQRQYSNKVPQGIVIGGRIEK